MYVSYICDVCELETSDQEVNSGDTYEIRVPCWNCSSGTMHGYISYDETLASKPVASSKSDNKIKISF